MQGVPLDRGRLFKQARSPFWSLDVSLPGRKRQRLSLGTRSKDDARRIANQRIREALEDHWGVGLEKESTFDEFLKDYELHARARNTARTVELNLQILRSFQSHAQAQSRSSLLLSRISPELIDSFVISENDRGLNAWTINRHLGALSSLMALAQRRRVIRANPVKAVPKLPVIKRKPDFMSRIEVEALLRQAARPVRRHGPGGRPNGSTRERHTPIHDMVFFALNTGARLGELLFLEWADIDFERGVVNFKCKPEHQTKDRDERSVGLNGPLRGMLTRRRKRAGQHRWVFAGRDGTVIDRANALRELKAVAGLAKVETNFQKMRRTFLTMCSESVLPFLVKSWAGHSSVRTTERYYIGNTQGSHRAPPPVGRPRLLRPIPDRKVAMQERRRLKVGSN